MDYPGEPEDPNKILEERKHLDEIQSTLDEAYSKYHELELSVDKLGSAVEAHPETGYEHDSETFLYRGDRKTEIDVEMDIAVLLGTTSQKWKETKKSTEKLHRYLKRYREELNKDVNPLPEDNNISDSHKELRQELRETEKELEDIAVETYLLLGEQPSPDSRTVLQPNSSRPIASD
jgi:hypothetical protein